MFSGLTRGMYTFLLCVFKNENHAVKALHCALPYTLTQIYTLGHL